MESAVTPEKPEIPWMKSLSSCTNRMKEEGFKEDFQVTDRGLTTFDKGKHYQPDQVKIVSFYRFEGESDPDDNAILYIIETSDGTRGTIVDAYGIYNDSKLTRFIKDVEAIQKKSYKREP